MARFIRSQESLPQVEYSPFCCTIGDLTVATELTLSSDIFPDGDIVWCQKLKIYPHFKQVINYKYTTNKMKNSNSHLKFLQFLFTNVKQDMLQPNYQDTIKLPQQNTKTFLKQLIIIIQSFFKGYRKIINI